MNLGEKKHLPPKKESGDRERAKESGKHVWILHQVGIQVAFTFDASISEPMFTRSANYFPIHLVLKILRLEFETFILVEKHLCYHFPFCFKIRCSDLQKLVCFTHRPTGFLKYSTPTPFFSFFIVLFAAAGQHDRFIRKSHTDKIIWLIILFPLCCFFSPLS